MATPISRDTLNRETNARFWLRRRHKVGERLDPSDPRDQAEMPVWMSIFREVQAEARANKLVTTYDDPEVIQALAAARLASSTQQPPAENGARPEADPWDQGPVLGPPEAPVLGPPPRPAPARPSPAPARPSPARRPSRPSRDEINRETNLRFWGRTGYKPHERLDMSIEEDRRQSETWMEIFREVEREANQGRMTLTDPETIPPPAPEEAPPPTSTAPPGPTPDQSRPPSQPTPVPPPEPTPPARAEPDPWAPGTAPPIFPFPLPFPFPQSPAPARPSPETSAPGTTSPGFPFPFPLPFPFPQFPQSTDLPGQPQETRLPGQPSGRPTPQSDRRPQPAREPSPPTRGPEVRQPSPARETRPRAETPVSSAERGRAPREVPTTTPTRAPTRDPSQEAPKSTAPKEPTTTGAPAEGMGTLGLLAIGVFGVTAVLSLVYAASRRPSERSGARMRSSGQPARPFPTYTATRGWR